MVRLPGQYSIFSVGCLDVSVYGVRGFFFIITGVDVSFVNSGVRVWVKKGQNNLFLALVVLVVSVEFLVPTVLLVSVFLVAVLFLVLVVSVFFFCW